jgi:hypothetical protein
MFTLCETDVGFHVTAESLLKAYNLVNKFKFRIIYFNFEFISCLAT